MSERTRLFITLDVLESDSKVRPGVHAPGPARVFPAQGGHEPSHDEVGSQRPHLDGECHGDGLRRRTCARLDVRRRAYAVPIHHGVDDVPTPSPYIMEKNAKGKLIPKLDSRDMPVTNPNYEEDLLNFAKTVAPRFDELKNRQAFGRRAAHGFNITLELLRRARNINFANEVCQFSKKGGGSSL